MQTAISPVRSVVRDIVRRHPRLRAAVKAHSIPESFEQALREGWMIRDEQTTLGVDKRHRHGVVTLTMEGRTERLAVSYIASVKSGYEFSKPELMK